MTTRVNNRMIDGAVVNVIDFGADPSGLTDSSAAFQEAVDFVKSVSQDKRGAVKIPVGEYLVSGVDVDSAVELKGESRHGTILSPTTTGYMFRFRGQAFGMSDVRFIHDRSFNADCIRLEEASGAPNAIQKWFSFDNIMFEGFAGSAILALSTLWESELIKCHARQCGNPANDRAVFDFRTSSTGDATNNITFAFCKVIFPQYYGVRMGLNSTTTFRKIKFLQCMLHGGTNDGDLTPAPYDMVQLLGFSRCSFLDCNLTFGAPNHSLIYAKGDVGDRSTLLEVSMCEIEGANADSQGIECLSVANVNISSNQWANMSNAYHMFFDSDCARVHVEKQQVTGGLPLLINNNAISYTGYVDDTRQVGVTFNDGVNGSNNYGAEVLIPTSAANANIVFPIAEPDTNYAVKLGTNFDGGGPYITNKTVNGFTVNFPTPPAGVTNALWYWVDRFQ